MNLLNVKAFALLALLSSPVFLNAAGDDAPKVGDTTKTTATQAKEPKAKEPKAEEPKAEDVKVEDVKAEKGKFAKAIACVGKKLSSGYAYVTETKVRKSVTVITAAVVAVAGFKAYEHFNAKKAEKKEAKAKEVA